MYSLNMKFLSCYNFFLQWTINRVLYYPMFFLFHWSAEGVKKEYTVHILQTYLSQRFSSRDDVTEILRGFRKGPDWSMGHISTGTDSPHRHWFCDLPWNFQSVKGQVWKNGACRGIYQFLSYYFFVYKPTQHIKGINSCQ